jgi:hypothetical protein
VLRFPKLPSYRSTFACELRERTVTPPAGAADFALNTVDSSADQYAVGVKSHFSPFVSWYMVGSYLRNGRTLLLGVSGHGYGVCGRDANTTWSPATRPKRSRPA